MVRRIRSCSRCQRRFTSTSGEASCPKCCLEREQLNAVLPRNNNNVPHVHVESNDTTFASIVAENDADTQQEPTSCIRSKRPIKTTTTNTVDYYQSTIHSLAAATADDDDDSSDDSENDSDNDIPLANLFQKAAGAAASDPIVMLDDSSIVDKGDQPCCNDAATKGVETKAAKGPIVQNDSRDKADQAFRKHDAASEPIVLDHDSILDKGEQATSNDDDDDDTAAFPPTTTASLSDSVCFICGSDLKNLTTGLKGRLNHLKRCSKKHGVSARHVKLDDDSELFVEEKPAAAAPTEATITTTNADNLIIADKNDSWHNDAAIDLALAASHCADSSSISMHKENVANPKEPDAAAKVAASSKQTSLGNFFQMPVRSLNNVLLAGARRMAKTTELLSAPKKSGNITNASKGKRKRVDYSNFSCPMYKKIPGTDFVCDGFMYAKSSLTKNYFLTHFHSDHYGGINKHWNAGVIYCSLETANLVHQQLGVDRKFLHPLGLMTPTIIESSKGSRPVSVTLMDANHCPGAVMFLFEVGKRRILHVGDFRWNRELMTGYAPLRAFSTLQYRLDDLFLDTTYCDEKYTLPTQAEAIRATVEVAEKEWQQSKTRGRRALFLFGAYTIGKERIYLSVAERLRCKVYVDKARYRVLSALNWPRERMSLLTTNKEESSLWVVPLNHINFKKMQNYLGGSDKVFSKKKYDRVVGFRPTGWSMSARSSGIVSSQTRGSFTVHGIPYSEHSSFNELVDCLDCLKPKRIIPTVSASKSAEQVDLLLRNLKKQGR